MLQAIERYMKQAIVDKVSSVSSSALVSSLVSDEAAAVSYTYMVLFLVKTNFTIVLSQEEQSKMCVHPVTLSSCVLFRRILISFNGQ